MLERFELDEAGVGELLRSDEVMAMLMGEASARCPDGCVVNAVTGKRVNVRIVAETDNAKQDNLDNNTLLQAIS